MTTPRVRPRTIRLPRVALVAASLLLLAAGGRAVGGDHRDEYEQRHEPGRCRCHHGKATWPYLRSPLAPPEDPPHCGLALSGGSCATRPRPDGTARGCWGDKTAPAFWRRHAWSWGIRCSECWKVEDPEKMDDEPCASLLGLPDPVTGELLAERIASEKRSMGRDIVVAVSPHFYVVTNLHKKVKVRTNKGSLRLMSAHEVAHLYAQRCEQAYDDFLYWFGGSVDLHKPMAVYVVNERSEAHAIGGRYFGGPKIHMNYAFNYKNRIAEGFSGNGFVVAYEEQHGDQKMHGFARHQIGHILFSCWLVHGGFEEECPRWAWVGAAHFLEKLLPTQKDYATYCYGEAGAGGEGSGKRWPKRVRDLAAKKLSPIETFFGKATLGAFAYDDHLRAWSMMDLGLREDRDRWLNVLGLLRKKQPEGVAFKQVMGITPEVFHERWVERVLGRRKSLGPERKDDRETVDDPGRRERVRLAKETDLQVLAGLLRGLDHVRDVKTAKVVVGRLDTDSDLIRETIHLLLAKTRDPEVLAYLREEALFDKRPLVRSGVARALGKRRDPADRLAFERLLADDKDWLVRANVAEALGSMRDPDSLPHLLEALRREKNLKTWIVIADAYASFAGRSAPGTKLVVKRLDDKHWQVRLTVCQALVKIGTVDAMDPLVRQFAKESGRLKRELHAALKAIANDDLGPNPRNWQRWWEEQKAVHGGLPPRPEREGPTEHDARYGGQEEEEDEAHYYGRRFFSRSVCFVLDISESMKMTMAIEPAQAARLGDLPTEGSRMDIAKHALIDTLRGFDPRTRFRLVLFNSQVKLWQDTMTPATPANVAAAERGIRYLQPATETNFHGALKAALGLHEMSSLRPKLDPIPDTVWFLTDGRPTKGEITTMPELISWVENLNRFAKVTLHVIALGDLNVDAPRLKLLAEAGGGEMIHVRER